MNVQAARCLGILEVQGYGDSDLAKLDKRHAIKLLAELRMSLAPKSVASYYGAFRRMLSLAGRETPDWPRPPTPPRKTRDAMIREDTLKVIAWLESKGWSSTADLAWILLGCGLRIGVEALTEAHLVLTEGVDYDTLHVTGKGEHERLIPVVSPEARDVLRDPKRLAAVRSHSYSGHLQRWHKAVISVGVQSRLATPHAVRHGYACEVLAKSGGNLTLVQELLGHADPGTTAKYLSVNLDAKAKAVT